MALKIKVHEKLTAAAYTTQLGNLTLTIKPVKDSDYLAFTLETPAGISDTFFLRSSDVSYDSKKVKDRLLASASNIASRAKHDFDSDKYDISEFSMIYAYNVDPDDPDAQELPIEQVLADKLTVNDLNLDVLMYKFEELYHYDDGEEMYDWFVEYLEFNKSSEGVDSLTTLFRELNTGLKNIELDKVAAKFGGKYSGNADPTKYKQGTRVKYGPARDAVGRVLSNDGKYVVVKTLHDGEKKITLANLDKFN